MNKQTIRSGFQKHYVYWTASNRGGFIYIYIWRFYGRANYFHSGFYCFLSSDVKKSWENRSNDVYRYLCSIVRIRRVPSRLITRKVDEAERNRHRDEYRLLWKTMNSTQNHRWWYIAIAPFSSFCRSDISTTCLLLYFYTPRTRSLSHLKPNDLSHSYTSRVSLRNGYFLYLFQKRTRSTRFRVFGLSKNADGSRTPKCAETNITLKITSKSIL